MRNPILWAFIIGTYWMTCMILFRLSDLEEVCTEPEPVVEELTLPQKCAHLYDVGRSVEWQECMGVGPK